MSTGFPPPTDDNFDVAGDIVSVPYYYTYVPGSPGNPPTQGYYTNNNDDDLLDYAYANKVSVGGATGSTSFTVDVQLGGSGADDVLFYGDVGNGGAIPKALALQCAAFFGSQVIDLSAGPMTYARYLQVGAADKTGAYLLSMTGTAFTQDLAQMNAYKSIAMVDIAKGTALLENDESIHAAYVEITGGAMSIKENLDYAGNLTLVQGSVAIQANETAAFTGIFNDIGAVSGSGALEIVRGDFSVADGASVNVKTWLSRGSANAFADDYIDTALDYKGDFIVGADTKIIFYRAKSLTVKEINDINGLGGTFDLADWDGHTNGDEKIDVLGAVQQGEAFNIGSTDVLELGNPTKFSGVIDSMTTGLFWPKTAQPLAGGKIELVGNWNFVSEAQNSAQTETIVTMKDTANNLTAHIAFADLSPLTEIPAAYFEFFDQLQGVTPTTVITPYVAQELT